MYNIILTVGKKYTFEIFRGKEYFLEWLSFIAWAPEARARAIVPEADVPVLAPVNDLSPSPRRLQPPSTSQYLVPVNLTEKNVSQQDEELVGSVCQHEDLKI